ncbi:nicalin-1-like [Tropilaelaps mercedesae]|uniref:BOS complex subunit NCLN n=1 Tax=Tropilaelaps mercedesae TaxID=418985 RepID=A0A1V9X6B7_9ACAR|nr:nicalin-1-like [Tropilaelaps mercedesae]
MACYPRTVTAGVLAVLLLQVEIAQAAVELPVYRMQQYELHGISRGTRASSLSGEAISWSALSQLRNGAGRVAVLRWGEIHHLREVIAKGVAGAILVLPPEDSSIPNKETESENMALEHDLFEEAYSVAVYLVRSSPDIEAVLSRAASSSSAAFDLSALWAGTATQFSIQAAAPKQIRNPRLPTLWAKLVGFGLEEQLPTISIVAHYDAFGAAPQLSRGTNSNASGVAALLELMRLFSRLYGQSKTHPRANLIFILSAGGKLNYLGIKKLIDDAIEGSNVETSLLAEAQFSMCLEAIGGRRGLHAHVSKPPRAGQPMGRFFDLLNATKSTDGRNLVSLVHKKINLAEEMRVWEHERFSLSKLPAFTLSSHGTHNVRSRYSIFDRYYDIDALAGNVQDIAASLAAFIYQKRREVADELMAESLAVDNEHLKAVVAYLANQPRSAVLHASRSGPSQLVITLKEMMARFIPSENLGGAHRIQRGQSGTTGSVSGQVHTSYYEPDRRDPELVIYDQTEETILSVNEVKPVTFDLVLLACIALYLLIVYGLLLKFGVVVSALQPTPNKKID